VIDPRIDEGALRTERLARLQAAMDTHGLVACLLLSMAIAKMPAKPSMPDLCKCGVACECADPREER